MKTSWWPPAAFLIPILLCHFTSRVQAATCPAPGFVLTGPFSAGTLPAALTVDDFDEDGHLDLAIANRFSANVSVLLGVGDGGFLAASNHAVGNSPSAVATGDVNDDGKPDLIVCDSGSANVFVLLG